MVISTNIQALRAAHNLGVNELRLSKSLSRLSSGSKIVDPTDDAAGLAVGMRLDAHLKRLNAAKINTANAMSLTQMQDGYMSKVAKALDRMSELAMLSQDIIKSDGDRSLYNREFVELVALVKANAGKNFNGVTLFSGAELGIACDPDGGGFNMKGVNLGLGAYNNALHPLTAGFSGGMFTVNGMAVTVENGERLDQILTKISAATGGAVTATYAADKITLSSTNPITLGAPTDTSNFLELTQLKSTGTNSVVSAPNTSWSPSISNPNFLVPIQPGTITVGGTVVTVAATDNLQQVFDKIRAATTPAVQGGYDPITDKITLSSTSALTLGAPGDTSNFLTATKLSGNGTATVTSSEEISSFLSSTAAAVATLEKVKAAIVQVAEHRAQIGASQARLSYTAEQLTVQKENIMAASSRIQDVDVAEESTEYARFNVLAQAATAMLAQANVQPQNALKLLQ